MNLQKHWRIAILAVLAIGPGLMINSALIPSQSLIQNSFRLSNNVILAPLLLESSPLRYSFRLAPYFDIN
jgi:hypothetical protein